MICNEKEGEGGGLGNGAVGGGWILTGGWILMREKRRTLSG